MKYLFLFLVVLLLIGGCAAEVSKEEDIADQQALTDEQVLQEYPDGLDDALQELDALES